MMAEGQSNGNDSPERDSDWQPAPGDGRPEADTDPGAGQEAAPGASWLPFNMTSPADEAGQPATPPPAPETPAQPWAPPATGAQPAPGPMAPGPQAAAGQPGPGQ